MTGRLLVVDDDDAIRYTLRVLLEDAGYGVEEAADGRAALARLDDGEPVDLVLTDLRMPGMGGLALLDALAARAASPRAVVITAHGSERAAVDAMKAGALDYFTKPFDADEIVRVVQRSLAHGRALRDSERLAAGMALARFMVFESPAMYGVAEVVERLRGRDVTVLITGETGTGKELVARALVAGSTRANRAFVQVNAAALTESLAEAELFGHARGAYTGADRVRKGMFREADGGTLFLDEVGELSPSVQASLLRVLQERAVRGLGETRTVPVDVRLIAATHRELATDPTFRQDLYWRLDVVRIHVPALRERPEDVEPLAHHFARRSAERLGLGDVRLSAEVVRALVARQWPGNVRELEHAVERLVALSRGPVVDPQTLALADSREARPVRGLKDQVAAFERNVVAEALRRNGGNRSAAARDLGVSRVTLLDKIARYGL